MTYKILVVDDEADLELLIRQRFRRQIRAKEFEFSFAHNGVEALQKLNQDPEIDLVLTDINMPEMDGLTLLNKLNDRNSILKAVVVSAYGDMDNIRVAMNRGAFDFLTKPIDFQDLDATIQKSLNEINNLKKALELRDKFTSLKEELSIAAEIQQTFLPRPISQNNEFRGFYIEAIMTPAREVGGDFFDYFLIDEDRLAFVIADVSGKGVPAAMFMAVSRTVLRVTGKSGLPAGETMRAVNYLLCQDNSQNMFVTTFYGILDTKTGQIEYSNGGHNIPYIVRASGEVIPLPKTKGMALGVFEEAQFEQGSLALESGDSLFLYTDGVTEAMNNQNDLYQESRLESILNTTVNISAPSVIPTVLDNVRKFTEGAEQSDDITMVFLRKSS